MKRRILSVLLTVAMAAVLAAGCGNKPAETQAPETTAESVADSVIESVDAEKFGEGKFVGITVPSVGNDFMLALTNALKEAVEATGATCQIDACDGDTNLQIQHIENYVTMGASLIVAFPVNGEALATACKQAEDQGIPTFAFAMGISDDCTTTMLSAEESDMGAACAEMASQWIDKTFPDAADGEVVVYHMTSSYSPEATERCKAQAAIAENSKVTLISEEVEDWNSAEDARSRVENAFLANPDIDVIITCNGTTALGVESYIASSDCPVEDLSKFGIFTVDETAEIVEKITASADNTSTLRGTISMGSIADTVNDFMMGVTPILKGEEPIKVINGEAKMITVDTLE